eukprot:6845266-Prymnesium_polylepis.1
MAVCGRCPGFDLGGSHRPKQTHSHHPRTRNCPRFDLGTAHGPPPPADPMPHAAARIARGRTSATVAAPPAPRRMRMRSWEGGRRAPLRP